MMGLRTDPSCQICVIMHIQRKTKKEEKVNLGRRWVAKLLAGAVGTVARLKQLKLCVLYEVSPIGYTEECQLNRQLMWNSI